jgi:hypothetical protein
MMLNLSYMSNEMLLYTDEYHAKWSIRLVQDVFDFTELISQLSCMAEDIPSQREKIMIVSSDYRAKIAVNAFIRFCPSLDGLIFTADSIDEAYAFIRDLES